MIHVPILRAGRPYYSKHTLPLCDYATGEPVAEVSQANPGLISRDLRGDARRELREMPVTEILKRLRQAAGHFVRSELPLGETAQSPEDFVALQSATTGLPHALCRQNMNKIEAALTHMGDILDGLTGGLDPAVIDAGYGTRDGHTVSFAPKARRFGAVLPANSPGVHALWLPALALKTSLALRPGQREPWTPLRIVEAMRRAGLPNSAFGFYPSGHAGAAVILNRCGASMLFGAGPTVGPYRGNSRIEIHGPGYSKILLGPDLSPHGSDFLEMIATSVAGNGGRSCINASSIVTPSHGRELAEGLARRLVEIVPRRRDDPQATLCAFADPAVAASIDAAIERGLAAGRAIDVTASLRGSPRLVRFQGGAYLLPTVVYCDGPDHPLANREYLFPYVSVVPTDRERLVDSLGPSLVVTALTGDPPLERALLDSAQIGRLNLGPIPTNVIQWDQPHEGNLFEHLYRQRAFQREEFAPAAVG